MSTWLVWHLAGSSGCPAYQGREQEELQDGNEGERISLVWGKVDFEVSMRHLVKMSRRHQEILDVLTRTWVTDFREYIEERQKWNPGENQHFRIGQREKQLTKTEVEREGILRKKRWLTSNAKERSSTVPAKNLMDSMDLAAVCPGCSSSVCPLLVNFLFLSKEDNPSQLSKLFQEFNQTIDVAAPAQYLQKAGTHKFDHQGFSHRMVVAIGEGGREWLKGIKRYRIPIIK